MCFPLHNDSVMKHMSYGGLLCAETSVLIFIDKIANWIRKLFICGNFSNVVFPLSMGILVDNLSVKELDFDIGNYVVWEQLLKKASIVRLFVVI